jgi:sortase A
MLRSLWTRICRRGNVVVLGQRRICALLLAAAGTLACLILLFTTSSGAQEAQAVARPEGAVAAAGEDCVEFEDEGNTNDNADTPTGEDEATDEQTTASEGDEDNTDTELDSVQNENNDAVETEQINDTGGTSGHGVDLDVGTRQQSDIVTGWQVQEGASGDIQQSLQLGDEGDSGNDPQSQQPEDEDNGDDTSSLQDEEDGATTSNDATSEDVTPNDATANDAEDNDGNDDECIVAESVPDELLPPTGVSARSQNDGPAEKKEKDSKRQKRQSTRGESPSDRNEKTSDRDGGQKKTGSAKEQRSRIQEQRSRIQEEKQSGGSKKVVIKDRSSSERVEVEDRSSKEPRQESLGANSKAATTPDPAPRLAANWPSPSRREVAVTEEIRRFAPRPGSEMTMSVRALGLYDAPVASSGRREDLDNGLIRMPQTDLPWEEGDEKNVYVAGHYLGLEETNSRMVFYNLHELKKGDEIALKDELGQVYKYRVSEKFAAESRDSWAMGEVRDRDMLTLQTCIPPDFGKRLLVRADRVRDDR